MFFKAFKAVKAVKVALAAASLAAYSWLFSWQVAVALMYIIAIHEMGHVWAMRRYGVPSKGFYFIPFLGGAAIGGGAKTERQDVIITLMGPAFGLLSLLPAMLAFAVSGAPVFIGVVTFGALINLFNLLPIMPLDGGRVVQSVVVSVRQRWVVGVLLTLTVIGFTGLFWLGAWFIIIIAGFGMWETVAHARAILKGEAHHRETLSTKHVLATFGGWFGLAAVFIAIIFASAVFAGGDLAKIVLKS